MRPFVENFPFFSIFLAILAAIVTAAIRSGRISYWITIGVCAASALLNGWVLEYTYTEGVSFTYAMGRFLAPYGNAINCGPLQALLAAVFSLVMALALAGGRRDLFQDILPEKQKFYFVMVNMLEASLLALTYTNDMFTGYVFIETSTIAACALVMAQGQRPQSDRHHPVPVHEPGGVRAVPDRADHFEQHHRLSADALSGGGSGGAAALGELHAPADGGCRAAGGGAGRQECHVPLPPGGCRMPTAAPPQHPPPSCPAWC